MVVLRGQGGPFYEAAIWRAALGWLSLQCHCLFKRAVNNLPTHDAISQNANTQAQEDLHCQQHETLAALLNQLDLALCYAARELASPQSQLGGRLYLGRVEATTPASRFGLN